MKLLNVTGNVTGSASASTSKSSDSSSANAILDFVFINASALLLVAGLANGFRDGVMLARESVQIGRA